MADDLLIGRLVERDGHRRRRGLVVVPDLGEQRVGNDHSHRPWLPGASQTEGVEERAWNLRLMADDERRLHHGTQQSLVGQAVNLPDGRAGLAAAALFLLAGCAMTAAAPPASNEVLKAQVRATETAFAKTMADRDHAAFTSYLAEETVFFSPQALHGRKAVAEAWAPFYQGPRAPFSWRPA